ncbi:hypothetical protein [Blastococcus sp. PRF04-17]|uniref:hypothetical protein n=1 Tax=Blastococcus sp. PRF04-17 TaxID=2933797 RepID=UPI001FF49BA1|nr:hypothetical protein [Blastococcus sp. PRF04-17]UOY01829.1 hypothetical protein MVA48_00110 [Blastococcus sp. PRF04-17]
MPGPPQNLPGLLSVRAADAPRVDDLEGRWAAQLAAAEIDDDDAATAFAAQHHQLDSHLPVLLARGDDLGAPELDDETWLTVLDQPFGSRTEAARWCAGNGVAGCTPLLVTG